MQDHRQISRGFADPVFESQAAFRALLAALSEPGTIQTVPAALAPPDGLGLAAATTLLTLADYETPIWLPETLRSSAAGAWLRFHCGAALVPAPGEALFAVLAGTEAPRLSEFAIGTDQYPDRSATVLVPCTAFEGGDPVTLSGPGIADRRTVAPAGLRPGFWQEMVENAALYPLGVDVVLCHGEALIGLPRSTEIAEGAMIRPETR